MQATSVRWLGEIPASWRTEALKRNTYIKARVGWKGLTSAEFEESAFAYLVTGNDFRGRFIKWENCYQVSRDRFEDDPFIQLQDGDLLVTKDGTIGKTAIVAALDKPACLNSGVFVLRPGPGYLTEFLYWVLNSEVFRQFIDITSSGSTILHLYQNVLVDFVFGIPSVAEQSVIARHLDRETAEIDAFIADQKELVALLTERRASAILRGVSAQSANGEKGWTEGSLRRLIDGIDQGVSPQAEEGLADGDGEWGVLKAGCVNGGVFRDTEHKRLPAEFAIPYQARVRPGDLLVNRASGSIDLLGSAGVVGKSHFNLVLSDKTFRLRLSPLVDPQWMYWFLNSDAYRQQIKNSVSGAEGLANNLPMSTLRSFRLSWPQIAEQRRTVAALEQETSAIDAAIADAREAIALSKERRSALISAAVTGKIDVEAR